LPASSWDIPLLYDDRFYQVLPLSGDVMKNGGTVTIQVSTSGDGSDAGIYATLYGDIQFTMTQTPYSFRPMDASDPASNCPAFDPNNPVSDDCHIVYQLGILWPSQGEIVVARPPLVPLRRDQSRQQTSASSRSAALATLAPYSNRRMSRPTLSGGQGQARSATQSSPAATGRGRGTAPRDNEYGDLTTTYNLTLSLPTAAPGAPAAAWLPGTSTNYTPPGRDPAEPDYVFDNDTGGLTDSYVDLNGWGYTSVVTSQDFGGVAELRATATVQGMTFDVNVVDSNGNAVTAPADSATRLCGTDFAQHPYASLPVDQDCNGIADSWEQPYIPQFNSIMRQCGRAPITAFKGDEDFEPTKNSDGTLSCTGGDGLTIRDEYRGFHTLVQTPSTGTWNLSWASTDPVNTQDTFYMADWNWPAVAATPPYGQAYASRPVVDSINALLIPKIPAVAFHRVTDPYAGVKDPVSFKRSPLTANSPASTAYVIEFNNADVQVENPSRQVDADTLGVSTVTNDGSAPIDLYPSRLAQDGAMTGFPPEINQDVLVAHEAGHKLTLKHPLRWATQVPYNAAQVSGLTLGQFMVDPSPNTIHIALSQYGYSYPLSNTRVKPFVLAITGDKILDYTLVPAAGCPLGVCQETHRMPAAYNADVTNVFKMGLASPINGTSIGVATVMGDIMDWKTRLTRQELGDWSFSPLQSSQVCVQSSGDCPPFFNVQ
jgi:hypothetical protein